MGTPKDPGEAWAGIDDSYVFRNWKDKPGGPMLPPTVPFTAYHDLQTRYDGLVRELLAMKRDGFDTQPEHLASQPVPGLPKEIIAALNELGAEGAERRALMERAQDLLAGEMEAVDIASLFLDGEPVEL